ncbi:MAG: Maf family nucleotide pyrophosphatase [Pseudomonadota bacterium]
MADPLILASQSSARRDMLVAAGVLVETCPAKIDEPALRQALDAEGAKPRDLADALAEAKAQKIARRFPQAVVLGADQVLVLEDLVFEKVSTGDAAREVLKTLSGKRHTLLSAAVIYEGGAPVWRTVTQAHMHMRPLSDAFLDQYLDATLPDILHSVGCYHLEGLGAQLFDRVDGDYFTVLGLPLLPILGFLRSRGMLPA